MKKIILLLALFSSECFADCRVVESRTKTFDRVVDVDVSCPGKATLTNFTCNFGRNDEGLSEAEIVNTRSGVCHYFTDQPDPEDAVEDDGIDEAEYDPVPTEASVLVTKAICCR